MIYNKADILTTTIDSPWEIAIDDPESGSALYELPHVMNITMTFAPIHDFVPRKFPTTLNTIQEKDAKGNPQTVDDWRNLPAFMADRQANKNEWLTSIFGTDKKIPTGKSVNISSQKIQPTTDDLQQQSDLSKIQIEKGNSRRISENSRNQRIRELESSPFAAEQIRNEGIKKERIDRKERRINERNARIERQYINNNSIFSSNTSQAGSFNITK